MSFFDELKRRNVFKVGIAYAVTSWLLIQVTDILFDSIGSPPWVMQAMFVLLATGFVIALILAWAFEMTSEGVKKEKDVDRSQSITKTTGHKLDRSIILILVLALTYFAWDKFSAPTQPAMSVAIEEVAIENSIAVLPFANRSNLEDDLFFTDGIHDDLLTQLAKIKDLKVISRTSVMEYRDTTKKISEIARELGVSTILEGGIQRAGKRIRINAQLIDVATDEHLWAETFDREMTIENLFDIQSEITRQIVTAVKGELTESDQRSLATAPTDNLDAYEAYLQAKAATNRPDYSPKKYIEAQPWAERAVKLDPEFAEAWAILAEIHAQAVWQNYDNTPKRHAAASSAIKKALALNPDSAAVKAAQADYYYRFKSDYPAALAVYKQAQQIAPGDARIILHTAFTLRRLGLWTDAIESFEQALSLDPGNVYITGQLISTLSWMNEWQQIDSKIDALVRKYPVSGDLKGAQIQARIYHRGDLVSARELFDLLPARLGDVYSNTATELAFMERDFDAVQALLNTPEISDDAKRFGRLALMKGQAYLLAGDKSQAKRQFEIYVDEIKAWQTTGTYLDATRIGGLALAYAYLGEFENALETSRRAMAMLPLEKDHLFGAFITKDYALILALSGNRDAALQQLAASVDLPSGLPRWGLYLDPRWDFFRDDERFNELVRPKSLNEAGQ